MKKISKSLLTILCGAMIASAASCGNATGTALTIDGVDIKAGIYILNQQEALSAASKKLSEERPDLDMNAEGFDIKAQTIEGKNAEAWIKDKAIELCREYVAKNKLFEKEGLSLTAEQKSELSSNTSSLWSNSNIYAQYIYGTDTFGEYYESIGVSEQSYKAMSESNYVSEALFDHRYAEGGTMAVPASDINAVTIGNYAAVLYFEAKDGKAQEYADRISGGEDYAAVYNEYETAQEKEKLAAAKAEAEEKGEEYTGESPDDVNIEVKSEQELLQIISKTSAAPSEAFVADVFAMNAGETKVIAGTDETQYVVVKRDISTMQDKLDSYKEESLHSLKDDEFNEMIKSEASGYSVTENAAAISLYTLDKIIRK